MDELDLSYALAKKVPDMRRGFRVETRYGEIEVSAEEAKPFADLMQRMLEERRAALVRYNLQVRAPQPSVNGPDYLDRLAMGQVK